MDKIETYSHREIGLVFIDTNVLNRALDYDAYYDKLTNHLGTRACCTSAYNIHELTQNQERRNAATQLLTDLEVGLTQPNRHLLRDEVRAYQLGVNPIVANPPLLYTGDYEHTELLVGAARESIDRELPKGAKAESLRDFWGGRRTKGDGMSLELQTQTQLMISARRGGIEPTALFTEVHNPRVLPATKAQTGIHWYKLHQNPSRKAALSDVFDVGASGCFFYMDEVITEKQMGIHLKRIKNFYGMQLPTVITSISLN